MKHYLLSIEQPEGAPPATVDLISQEEPGLRTAGALVWGGGLHEPSTATVVHLHNGDLCTTDGPYSDGNAHVGGICIIRATDLDAALAWGGRLARVTTLPVEIRPFQGETST